MKEKKHNSARDLWADYLFLTREMHKAIMRHDFLLFDEILNQREKLQTMLDALPGDEFTQTAEGRQLVKTILEENAVMQKEFQYYANAVKNKVTVARAYEETGAQYAGNRMDRQS